MTYDYYCDKCQRTWEESHLSDDRDKPVGKPSKCCKGGKVKRGIANPRINYEGAVSMIKRGGSGWNDMLKRLKKDNPGSNIEHY